MLFWEEVFGKSRYKIRRLPMGHGIIVMVSNGSFMVALILSRDQVGKLVRDLVESIGDDNEYASDTN